MSEFRSTSDTWHGGSHRTALHALFSLSGACALVYQLAWVRYFTLEFGSTTLAVATVVATFMGGLAAGALWGGNLGTRSKLPLRTYGWLELGLSGYVLASPWTFPTIFNMLGMAVAGAHESFVLLTSLRFLAAVLLILPPTVLMGATLPVLTSWLHRQSGSGAYRATTLYSWNTLGAMSGVLAGGFWLLPEFGLQTTLWLAGSANLLIAGTCLAMSLGYTSLEAGQRLPAAPPLKSIHHTLPSGRLTIPLLVCLGVALAAAGTMASQVIWTRVAALVLGASVHAFTVVLGTFLAGLGIGALAVSWWLRQRVDHARGMFLTLLFASAVAMLATGYLFPFLPVWATSLHHALDLSANGAGIIHLQLMIAAALLVPPTVLFGGMFPAALRAFGDNGRPVSRNVGILYAWDVSGSIAGVLLAGFLLLPMLGASIALFLAAVALLLAAVCVQAAAGAAPGLKAGLAAGIAGAALWLGLPHWDRQLMTSGPHSYASAYRGHESPGGLADFLAQREELLYYADGLTATITVTREQRRPDREPLLIYIDGKIDGSSHLDMPTQRLAAHLPMLLHPQPSRVAIIGMGTGSTAGSAALHPGSQIRVFEIEARMVEAARLFREHNHQVHERDNVEIMVSDGRLHLLRQRDAYDVIVSAPSNPWLAGSSNLFTRDFFERAAGALDGNGLFAQWVHLYGMSSENLRMVLRGFLEAFPETLLATTIRGTDILLIGSKQPIAIDIEDITGRMAEPNIAADLADDRVGVESVYDLLARIRILPGGLRELAGVGAFHSDNHPLLAYRAPFDLYRNTRSENENQIAGFATGVSPLVTFNTLPSEQRREELEKLADAYARFLPRGREAVFTRMAIQRSE